MPLIAIPVAPLCSEGWVSIQGTARIRPLQGAIPAWAKSCEWYSENREEKGLPWGYSQHLAWQVGVIALFQKQIWISFFFFFFPAAEWFKYFFVFFLSVLLSIRGVRWDVAFWCSACSLSLNIHRQPLQNLLCSAFIQGNANIASLEKALFPKVYSFFLAPAAK